MSVQNQFTGGFTDPPVDAAYAFRAAMTVMARPGEVRQLTGATPPDGLSVAAGALLLTLCDPDTGVHLAGRAGSEAVRNWLSFHTGAPVVPAARADFAVGRWDELMPLTQFRIGTPEYPDRSATLIVDCDTLHRSGAVLRGPGIRDKAQLSLPGVPELQANAELYPLGCDFFFTCGDTVAALPRSTRIQAGK